ncbi:hypothetical protein [Niallia taxi]|uniref:hypothetical protein n=1 Tax=Niallia taxi TaxID=2499688 RepID=UPI0015F4E34C|nr:hypothetical protein [Niallia taxi]
MSKGKRWSEKEECLLFQHWNEYNWDQLCGMFGRTKLAIDQKARKMGLEPKSERFWTREEEEYLEDNWGSISFKSMSKKLNRSVNAIKLKGQALGLTRALWSIDDISLHQLSLAIKVDYHTVMNWIEKYDFPVKQKLVSEKARYKVVSLEAFWKWAKHHVHLIQFTKVERHILGKEPEWVVEQRKSEQKMTVKKQSSSSWSKDDIDKLIAMVNKYRYTYTDISKELKRSEAAIKRKLYDLKIKARPVRNSNVKWTPEQELELVVLFQKGMSFDYIGMQLGNKGEIAVRSKLERMGYITVAHVNKGA